MPTEVFGLIFIANMVFLPQPACLDIQVLSEGVGDHSRLDGFSQFGWRANPLPALGGNQLCNCIQHWVRRFFIQLVFHAFQIPDLGLRVLLQVEDLIRLIPPHHLDGSVQLRAFFLLHQQRTICTAQQPGGAGNRPKGIVCLLLPGVMDGQNTDPVLISKLLDSADNLIVAGIAVRFAAYLTDLLHSVNDDEIGVRVLLHEILQLFIQPISNLSSGGGGVEVGGCRSHRTS